MPETKLRAMRIRRNPWVTALSCVPWGIAAGLAFASFFTSTPWVTLAPPFTFGGIFAFLAAWRGKPWARQERVDVSVGDGQVQIGDQSFALERVTRAEILPTAGGPLVRVRLRSALARDLGMADEGSAHELMTALGYDVSQRIAEYRAGSLALTRYRWSPILMVPLLWGLFLLGGALHVPPGMIVVPIMLVVFGALYASRSSVVVGADGVLVRWMWLRWFIPIQELLGAERFVQGSGKNKITGLEIQAERIGALRLPLGEDETAMLRQRIRDALSLSRSSAHVADEALLLTRGELPMRDWIARLKALGMGATATLRSAAVMPEQLWRVAADPAQPATARAAAAIALSPTLDTEGRVRLGDLARATAEPRLRVALERAASDAPDAELEETLNALSEKS